MANLLSVFLNASIITLYVNSFVSGFVPTKYLFKPKDNNLLKFFSAIPFKNILQNSSNNLALEILESIKLDNGATSLFDGLLADLMSLSNGKCNAIEIAKNYNGAGIERFLDTLELVISTTLLEIFQQPPPNLKLSKASSEKIVCLSGKYSEVKLFELGDLVKTSRELLLRSQGVRAQDIIDEIFISFMVRE